MIESEHPPHQLTHILMSDLKTELLRRLIDEVMRFIDDEVPVRRQHTALGQQIGQQQRMVHDDDVRAFGCGPRPVEETLVPPMEEATAR
jgi:hypothetical protein